MKKNSLLICLIVLLLACVKNDTIIREIPFEFEGNNNAPNLVSNNGFLTLSWIKSGKDGEATLQYSQLKKDNWENPKNVVTGTNWFINWADFPANAINDDLILTSYLKKSEESTYSYDVILNLQNLSGTPIKENFLLNTDGVKAEHGFVSMIPNKKNGFFVTWLDGRNTVKTHSDSHHKPMTIRVAEVSKNGTIFNENEIDGSTCDCCQTSITLAPNGPIVVYRDRSNEEIRDIYIARNVDGVWLSPKSVFNDNWQIKGCPVNGPKIVSDTKNIAVVWFTEANNRPSVNLSFSFDEGSFFESPIQINDGIAIGRVDAVFLNSKEVLVSYMEDFENNTYLKCKKVSLNGVSSKAFVIAKLEGGRATGVPQLEVFEDNVYAVWTVSEGTNKQLKSVKFNVEKL
jgi:hypothetical protein